jgi:hypothetical protein
MPCRRSIAECRHSQANRRNECGNAPLAKGSKYELTWLGLRYVVLV